MAQLRGNVAQQIQRAYFRMAEEARYRPAAHDFEDPISVDAAKYVQRWWASEERGEHVCNFETRPATIFTVEAARAMCAGENELAHELLRLALGELEQRLSVAV